MYEALSSDTGWDLLMVAAGDERPTPQRLLQTRANETTGRVSPDGRWLLYVSDESGAREVYLTRFPELQGKWTVSAGNGSRPFWRRDGREIFYLSADGRIMAVAIGAGAGPDVYTPDPGGQRLLIARPAAGGEVVPMDVILNPLR